MKGEKMVGAANEDFFNCPAVVSRKWAPLWPPRTPPAMCGQLGCLGAVLAGRAAFFGPSPSSTRDVSSFTSWSSVRRVFHYSLNDPIDGPGVRCRRRACGMVHYLLNGPACAGCFIIHLMARRADCSTISLVAPSLDALALSCPPTPASNPARGRSHFCSEAVRSFIREPSRP